MRPPLFFWLALSAMPPISAASSMQSTLLESASIGVIPIYQSPWKSYQSWRVNEPRREWKQTNRDVTQPNNTAPLNSHNEKNFSLAGSASATALPEPAHRHFVEPTK